MEMVSTDDFLVLGVDVSKANLDIAWGADGSIETIENSDRQITQRLIRKIKSLSQNRFGSGFCAKPQAAAACGLAVLG